MDDVGRRESVQYSDKTNSALYFIAAAVAIALLVAIIVLLVVFIPRNGKGGGCIFLFLISLSNESIDVHHSWRCQITL